MVLELAGNLLASIASFLWGSFLYSIPVFLAVWLPGKRLHGFFSRRWKRSWLQSAFLSSYALFFVLLIIAFFFPMGIASKDSAIGLVPAVIAPSWLDLIGKFLFGLFRIALLSAFFSMLALPLVFVGELCRDLLKKRFKSQLLRLFLSVWVAVGLAVLVLLFLVPWVVPGLVYLVYWA